MEFRLMTTQCKRTTANHFVLLAVSFFLLSRCCCCHADVGHRVKDIQNNATAGIILSVKSKEISGAVLGTALEVEASSTNKTLRGDKEAYHTNKLLTLEDDSSVTYTSDYNIAYQNVVDLATVVFVAETGGSYLLHFRGINNIGSSLRIKSSSTSIALLLVNDILRATSYANPGDRNIASISTVVNLERGDRVHIFMSGAGPFLTNATDDDGDNISISLTINKSLLSINPGLFRKLSF